MQIWFVRGSKSLASAAYVVYRYKHGGSMFRVLKKSLAKVGTNVIKAAKPLGKKNGEKRNESSYKSKKSKKNYGDGVFERGFIG